MYWRNITGHYNICSVAFTLSFVIFHLFVCNLCLCSLDSAPRPKAILVMYRHGLQLVDLFLTATVALTVGEAVIHVLDTGT